MDVKIKEIAEYCLNCMAKPCSTKGCPLSNDIPQFIKCVKDENIKEAYKVLVNTSILGSICSRICPYEKQCKGSCIRGIKGEPVKISEIEKYVFDEALKNGYYKDIEKTEVLKGKNIAVVGSGPAGLTCAAFLEREGASVTIYEKHNNLGGILANGIPEFRLPKEVLDVTIKAIVNSRINVELNKELGKNITFEELENNYDAIFLGIGANIPSKMGITGEELEGVYGGNTLLEKNEHPNYEGKKVAIIGGGNVAMDCARTIKRMGAEEVYVIYRRVEKQMPAERKEIDAAKEEGIQFLFQNNIVKILGNEKVEKIECIKTELVKKEGETREVPVDIEGSNYTIDMDYVVMAIGSKPDKNVLTSLNLDVNEKGYIRVNSNYQTSNSKVFAGGDIIGTTQTVAWAAKDGRDAAKAIKEFLL